VLGVSGPRPSRPGPGPGAASPPGPEADAAVIGPRLQAGVQAGLELGDGSAEEAEVHAAHELGVAAGEVVERAVAQHDRAVVAGARLVADLLQRPEDRRRGGAPARPLADPCRQRPALGGADLLERRVDLDALGPGPVDDGGEQPPGE